MNFHNPRNRADPEINLIPLIDIMLVIIVFLMVTTSFARISKLKVNLPSSGVSEQSSNVGHIEISISALGDLSVNGHVLKDKTAKGISKVMQDSLPKGKSKEEVFLIINADGKATQQDVVNVMEAAQLAEIDHVSFAVDQESR